MFFWLIVTSVSVEKCWALEPRPVVSMISLIAQPEKYDRKIVGVTGYMTLGFERNWLFLSPYDSQEFITDNAIFVDFGNALEPNRELKESDKAKQKEWRALFDHETVEVQGTFYYPKKEAFWRGYPNGILTNITDIQLHDMHLYSHVGRVPPK